MPDGEVVDRRSLLILLGVWLADCGCSGSNRFSASQQLSQDRIRLRPSTPSNVPPSGADAEATVAGCRGSGVSDDSAS